VLEMLQMLDPADLPEPSRRNDGRPVRTGGPGRQRQADGSGDAIRKREGRGAVRLGRVLIDPGWGMKRELESRYYIIKCDEVNEVRGVG